MGNCCSGNDDTVVSNDDTTPLINEGDLGQIAASSTTNYEESNATFNKLHQQYAPTRFSAFFSTARSSYLAQQPVKTC